MGRIIVAFMFALSSLMLVASPAQAGIVKHSGNIGNVAYENNRLIICDESIDGKQGYSMGIRLNGEKDTVEDTRGDDGHCPSINPPGTYRYHKVCEPGNGCSVYHRHPTI